MKYSTTFSVMLCVCAMPACAMERTADPTDPQPAIMTAGDEATSESTAPLSGQIQPKVTTTPIEHTFSDGCRIRFWCRNDNAAGDLAGFCILNACNGTAPAHARAFCSNTCPPSNCASITSFGACGPG